jgi:hypothetical protein
MTPSIFRISPAQLHLEYNVCSKYQWNSLQGPCFTAAARHPDNRTGITDHCLLQDLCTEKWVISESRSLRDIKKGPLIAFQWTNSPLTIHKWVLMIIHGIRLKHQKIINKKIWEDLNAKCSVNASIYIQRLQDLYNHYYTFSEVWLCAQKHQ